MEQVALFITLLLTMTWRPFSAPFKSVCLPCSGGAMQATEGCSISNNITEWSMDKFRERTRVMIRWQRFVYSRAFDDYVDSCWFCVILVWCRLEHFLSFVYMATYRCRKSFVLGAPPIEWSAQIDNVIRRSVSEQVPGYEETAGV